MVMRPGEVAVYAVVAASSIFLMGSVVHMLIGGMVSENTEYTLIAVVCIADAIAIGFMARDVIRRRRAEGN